MLGPPLDEDEDEGACSGVVSTGGLGRFLCLFSCWEDEPLLKLFDLKNPVRLCGAGLSVSAAAAVRSAEEAFDATSDLSDRLPVKAATKRRMFVKSWTKDAMVV